MPKNQLTPAGQNELGAAFGYYPQLRRNRTVQDPIGATEVPLQMLRGRVAGTLGLPSDVLNVVRSPMPMEAFGDVDYSEQKLVPYGTSQLLKELPLAPTSRVGQVVGEIGSFAPMTPAEALQAARLARQTALAGGKAAMAVGKAGERYAERVVPQVMERGGLPAQLLTDLSQGSRRPMYVPASQQEAFEASKLLRKNTPQEVWAKTGVAKYGDDFVKEISDKDAIAGFTHLEGVNNGEKLREMAFDNPELYALMPELKKFGQLGLREDRMRGSFQGVGDTGSMIGYAPNEKDLKTVMAHEMQHGIQNLQGWERGGSPKDIALDLAENKLKAEELKATLEKYQNKASDEARRANPELVAQATQWAEKTNPSWYQGADKNMIVKDYLLSSDPVYKSLYQNHADLAYNKPALLGAEETYKRLAGEVQARSTQNRVDLTDAERRQYFPFEMKSEANPYGLDVTPEDLLFRSQMGENQLRRSPKAAMEDQNQLRESRKNAPTELPQENALKLAQQRAALPKDQGGLGLKPNNTAAERAAAQGGKEAIHFSRTGGDFDVLDSGQYAVAPFDAVGTHVGTKEAALDRFRNTTGTIDTPKGSTYPVQILGDRPLLNQNGMPWGEDDLNAFLRKEGGHNWSDVNGGKMTYQQMNDALRKKLFEEQGYTSIPYFNEVEGKGSISYIVPPDNLRSRFAAFDPWRRNAAIAAAMGVAAPNLLAQDKNQLRQGR